MRTERWKWAAIYLGWLSGANHGFIRLRQHEQIRRVFAEQQVRVMLAHYHKGSAAEETI